MSRIDRFAWRMKFVWCRSGESHVLESLECLDSAWCRELNWNRSGTSRLDRIACRMEFVWCRSGDSHVAEFLEFFRVKKGINQQTL